MLKNIKALTILLLLVLAGACSKNENCERLRAEVEAADRSCPKSLGVSGSLESIEYDKSANMVVMRYVMNPAYVDLDAIRDASDEQKNAMGNFLKGESGRQMLDLLSAAGASIRLVFRAGDNVEPLSIELNADDIREIAADTDLTDNKLDQIRDIVAAEDRQCPDDYGSGVVLTQVALENGFMVYHISMPDGIDLTTSEKVADYRNALVGSLRSSMESNPLMRNTVDLLQSVGYGLRYRLVRPDSTNLIIDIMPDEIMTEESAGQPDE